MMSYFKPVDKSSLPLPPLITPPPPPPRLELMTKIGDRKKRFATNELDHGRLFKRSEPGDYSSSGCFTLDIGCLQNK